jgi:hypothetical protein
LGVLLFGFAAGFENKIQAAGGSLVDAGWTASKHLFSAQQKMQTNPCCSVLPSGGYFYWRSSRDSKGRPDRREGKKVSGGHFFSPWENPCASGRIHKDVDGGT